MMKKTIFAAVAMIAAVNADFLNVFEESETAIRECSRHIECGEYEFCNMGVCETSYAMYGDQCMSNEDCEAFWNNASKCRSGYCIHPRPRLQAKSCKTTNDCDKGQTCVIKNKIGTCQI